ncbi:hypothetical protein, partial [Brevundimonas sp. DC300-4]|uniref:hypothetical protein n=1 Tax=Brevundimonas sp. DC300-4 TaxID=2804594 RepID=UPI003CF39A12
RCLQGQGFWSHLRSFVTTTRPKSSSKRNPQSVSLALTADNPFWGRALERTDLNGFRTLGAALQVLINHRPFSTSQDFQLPSLAMNFQCFIVTVSQ